MTFNLRDRVVSVRIPEGVMQDQHTIGTAGVVTDATAYQNGEVEYFVEFDDGESWYCDTQDLRLETPLPTPEEAAAGLAEILGTETFEDYIERIADEYDPIMGFILGRERKGEA